MGTRLTQVQFRAKAMDIHDGKYSYKKAIYETNLSKLSIYCKECRKYFIQQAAAHLRGQGCPICAHTERNNSFRTSLKDFIKKAKETHGTKYSYSQVQYEQSHKRVVIHCKACKTNFEQSPSNHLKGRGCPSCAINRKRIKASEEFTSKAFGIHGDKYDYSDAVYVAAVSKVAIYCKACGQDFKQSPHHHITGKNGCPKCKRKGFSKMAIRWLEHEAKKRRIKIQHALNDGEFWIPGTRLRVDGYNRRSNTVFEFYGDHFHGNIKVLNENSKPNPFSTKTAKQLFDKTMKREEKLRALGYKVVSIWESDWKKCAI